MWKSPTSLYTLSLVTRCSQVFPMGLCDCGLWCYGDPQGSLLLSLIHEFLYICKYKLHNLLKQTILRYENFKSFGQMWFSLGSAVLQCLWQPTLFSVFISTAILVHLPLNPVVKVEFVCRMLRIPRDPIHLHRVGVWQSREQCLLALFLCLICDLW